MKSLWRCFINWLNQPEYLNADDKFWEETGDTWLE